MGIQLTKVIVDVKGYLDLKGLFGMDELVTAGFKKICYETSLESSADSETVRKLAQVVESHCPVYETLAGAVEVTGSVSINGKKKGSSALPRNQRTLFKGERKTKKARKIVPCPLVSYVELLLNPACRLDYPD